MSRTTQAVMTGMLVLAGRGGIAAAQSVERDLPYGAAPGQRLDLSTPASRGFPTVIFLHGGSLTSGDKADDDYRNACAAFPAAGIACANVNYRLAPAHAWPIQAADAAAAVAWVRANISAHGGDARNLFLFGHSSGATLAALLGADEQYLLGYGLKTGDLRGVVAMGSIMWDDELEQALTRYGRSRVDARFRSDQDNAMYASLDAYRDRWPMRHVRSGMPPYLFLIADSEQVQPPVLRTNRAFVERAVALGNRAEYQILPGRTHYSAIRQIAEPGDPVFAMVRDFVQRFSAGTSQ